MEIRWYQGSEPKISDIKATINEGQVNLTFKWPNELEQLYIYKQDILRNEEIDWEKPYRKYTKNEYACFGGFKDQDASNAMSKYVLCPYIHNDLESYLVRYENRCNEVEVISHRIEIHYEICEKKKLFSKRKSVQMQVFCEVPLTKHYLCYVKKKGNIPLGLEDGIQFQFISDFEVGENVLPEIEVEKDEYVRIYLTDEIPYKEAYRIMKS